MNTIVLCDSGQPVSFRRMGKSVLLALDHMGVWYEAFDINRQRLSDNDTDGIHLIVLAQEGIAKSLAGEEFATILKAVYHGAGLLILDGYLRNYPLTFLKALKIETFFESRTGAIQVNTHNSINSSTVDGTVNLKNPLLCHIPSILTQSDTILTDEEGNTCALNKLFGKGRVVMFLLSAGLWQEEYMGFTGGLDGVFRESVSWSAKKPFLMKVLPPFVTSRVGNVSLKDTGSATEDGAPTEGSLDWLDVFNRHGFRPNLGLLVGDAPENSSQRVRAKYFDGLAEFSAFAFGAQDNSQSSSIYLKEDGMEYGEEVLDENFARVDKYFSLLGVESSKTVNAMNGEVGKRALPRMKQRGQTCLMSPVRPGALFSAEGSSSWNVPPYGNPFFSLGFIPEDRQFFNATSLPGLMPPHKAGGDFLCGCTSFMNESGATDVQRAVKSGINQVKRGLANSFFGCLTTDRRRVARLSSWELDKIIRGIAEGIRPVNPIFQRYDQVSLYAKGRTFYYVSEAVYQGGLLNISLKGTNSSPQFLTLLLNQNGSTSSSFLEIPVFEKGVNLHFRL